MVSQRYNPDVPTEQAAATTAPADAVDADADAETKAKYARFCAGFKDTCSVGATAAGRRDRDRNRRASHVKDYTEAEFNELAKGGGKDNCFVVLWKGEACKSPGGVYQIAPAWTTAHLGGNLLSKKTCGKVIDNWLTRSGSHSAYASGLDANADIDGPSGLAATYKGSYDCGGGGPGGGGGGGGATQGDEAGEAAEAGEVGGSLSAEARWAAAGCEARRVRRAGHAAKCTALYAAYTKELGCDTPGRRRRAGHVAKCAAAAASGFAPTSTSSSSSSFSTIPFKPAGGVLITKDAAAGGPGSVNMLKAEASKHEHAHERSNNTNNNNFGR